MKVSTQMLNSCQTKMFKQLIFLGPTIYGVTFPVEFVSERRF